MESIILLTFLTALISSIASYVDKHLMNLGISGKDYFYYMCFSMIPFSFIVIIVKIILGQFKFELKKRKYNFYFIYNVKARCNNRYSLKYKINLKDIAFVDDRLDVLRKAEEKGIKAYHRSSFTD